MRVRNRHAMRASRGVGIKERGVDATRCQGDEFEGVTPTRAVYGVYTHIDVRRVSMSHQDFELIAKVLRLSDDMPPALHDLMAERFACALQSTNPRFDRQRFLRAAAVEPRGVMQLEVAG